jgi:hypothetical protein
MHLLLEMSPQSGKSPVPSSGVGSQPIIELLEWLWLQPVHPFASAPLVVNQPSAFEYSQMLGNCLSADRQLIR